MRCPLSLSLRMRLIISSNLFKSRRYRFRNFAPNLNLSLLQHRPCPSDLSPKIGLSQKSLQLTRYVVKRSMRTLKILQLSMFLGSLTKERCIKSSSCQPRSQQRSFSALSKLAILPKSQHSSCQSLLARTPMR